MHHGAEFNQNWLPVVSTSSQPMLGRERVHIVTPKILEAMSADLGTINYALSLSLFEAPNEEVRAAWQESADRPWLYKPV